MHNKQHAMIQRIESFKNSCSGDLQSQHYCFVTSKSGKGKVIGFSEHAEPGAIHACRLNYKYEGAIDVWVVRFKNSGELCNSYPCNNCLEFMRGQNVRKVTYSTEDGNIKTERLKDMLPQHVTRGNRRLNSGLFWSL